MAGNLVMVTCTLIGNRTGQNGEGAAPMSAAQHSSTAASLATTAQQGGGLKQGSGSLNLFGMLLLRQRRYRRQQLRWRASAAGPWFW
jgi:hypothetical protein